MRAFLPSTFTLVGSVLLMSAVLVSPTADNPPSASGDTSGVSQDEAGTPTHGCCGIIFNRSGRYVGPPPDVVPPSPGEPVQPERSPRTPILTGVALDGSVTGWVDNIARDTGMKGEALFYVGAFVIWNPDSGQSTRFDFEKEDGYFNQSSWLLTKNPNSGGQSAQVAPMSFSGSSPTWDNCETRTVEYLDAKGDPQLTDKEVCGAVQISSAATGGVANFYPRAQGLFQEAGLDGKPEIYDSDVSGAQLWWFNAWNPVTQFIEIRHVDGTIVRHDPRPGSEPSDTLSWRITSITDPFDNVTTYTYNGNELTLIAYPSGLREHWDWRPTNYWGVGYSVLRIGYSIEGQSAGDPWADSHAWGMVFENEGTLSHFGGRLYRTYHPKSAYVPETEGKPYDLSDSEEAYRITELRYDAVSGLLEEVHEYRHEDPLTSFDAVGAGPATDGNDLVRSLEYTGGRNLSWRGSRLP